jgi:hypothetical protein
MFTDRQPRSFLDPVALARLAAVPLVARRPMVGSVSGRHASPHRGSSVEFAEYRKYVPGDDLRRLDWRAFGRSDRHYVKEYEAETKRLELTSVAMTPEQVALIVQQTVSQALTPEDLAGAPVDPVRELAGQVQQMAMAMILDHFGALGLPVREISWPRIGGLVLVMAGLLLSRF